MNSPAASLKHAVEQRLANTAEIGLNHAIEHHMALCLNMAVTSLELITLEPPYTEHVTTLRDLIEQVEVSAVALTVESGVSWSAMASDYGVARQTLNRRLSRKTTKWLRAMHAANDAEISGRSRVWRHQMTKLRELAQELLGQSDGTNLAAARERLKLQHLNAIRPDRGPRSRQ
ncbi:hypothetical protein [Kribbella sp. ALI-6-A]|uniref:hypothetical protein n=1 Tax=Kribbella sp. ALI-6-A TaxID=1933817 RepID=UPI00117B11FF|nr:hypothetical protein [Kribbella sp. ALI-6-A]